MKKLIILAVVFSLIIVGAAIASVVSTKHDMRRMARANFDWAGASNGLLVGGTGYSVTTQVCVYCHHPHRSGSSGSATVLLWNNDMPTTSYTTYSSPTANATGMGSTMSSTDAAQYSRLCMGCHDGNSGINVLLTKSVDVTAGSAQTKTLTGRTSDIGGDTGNLTNDHPVDFDYPSAVQSSDDINVTGQSSNKIAGTYPLFDGTMQCATCHGVHEGDNSQDTKIQFMRASTANSKICTDCHYRK